MAKLTIKQLIKIRTYLNKPIDDLLELDEQNIVFVDDKLIKSFSNKKYRVKNDKKIKESKKEYYHKNRQTHVDKKRQYTKDNRETLKEKCKIYYQKNKEKILKQVRNRLKTDPRAAAISDRLKANYRAKKKRAIPKWLNKEQHNQILDIYIKCKEISKTTGILHSVDHIIPLQNKDVCGLHVPWNLQILTASENSTKKNKLIQPVEIT